MKVAATAVVKVLHQKMMRTLKTHNKVQAAVKVVHKVEVVHKVATGAVTRATVNYN
jgi:hypothetical protein